MRCVVDRHCAVAVGVRQSESLFGKRLLLGEMPLDRRHVADVYSAVKIDVADKRDGEGDAAVFV